MSHKKLTFALWALLSVTAIAPVAQSQGPVIATADATIIQPSMDTSGINCEVDSAGSDGSWNQSNSSSNASYGYFKVGLGYYHLKGSYSNATSSNTEPEILGNPVISGLSNPNYGEGMTLSTDSTSLSANSPLGSFEFGYNAALGQSRALLGFFAGINVMNAKSTFPVTMESQTYDFSGLNSEEITTENQKTVSADYTSTFNNALSFNAGITAGFRITDRIVALVKGGWTCMRLTSSKEQTSNENNNKGSGYSPTYINGFVYGGGIDFFLTERTSIGVEAFGSIYADKNITLFSYQTNPGNPTPNTTDATGNISGVGTVPSMQKLTANPLSASSWGIMATFKLNFLER